MHTCHSVGDLNRGESQSHQKGNLVATVWRDRKLVYVMSTNSDPQTEMTVQRKGRDGTSTTVSCPPNIVSYNKFMGGVDRADQLRNYYRVRSKSRKFYRYIFWFIFDSAIVNAFIFSKNFVPQTEVNMCQFTVKKFRLSLADALIGNYNSRQRYALPAPIREASLVSVSPASKRLKESTANEGHFPIKGSSGRCAFCWNFKNHRRHESSIRCRRCGKALCVVSRDPPENGPSCFERYHQCTQ